MKKLIEKGFILSGLINIFATLFSSRFFTNTYIAEFDDVVMSNFGLLMIMVWGLAYVAVAKNFEKVKWIVGVFAVEKLIYGFVWIKWLMNNDLSSVYEKDFSTGIFFSVYGLNDWVFFLFFSYVFIQFFRGVNLEAK